MQSTASFTELLLSARHGDPSAQDQLTPLILEQLHQLARRYMRQESPGHTLQPTALVNEAWLRLADMDVEWQDRLHFFRIAARQMRRILLDHARRRARLRHGGQLRRTVYSEELAFDNDSLPQYLLLEQLLGALEKLDPRAARLLELRLFAGLSNRDIGELEQLSLSTVERDIRLAKAWLMEQLETET